MCPESKKKQKDFFHLCKGQELNKVKHPYKWESHKKLQAVCDQNGETRKNESQDKNNVEKRTLPLGNVMNDE